jgi:UDP-N-acetylglucosamine 2-epimerase (non-hydrolysing)
MIAFVIGTRPEIVKLAPVMRAMPEGTWCEVFTGQHWDPQLVEAIRKPFRLEGVRRIELAPRPDEATWKVGRLIGDLEAVYRFERFAAVVVQGDTDTALAGALAGAATGIPVVHVEAGMRSYEWDLPEERNRRIIAQLASLHCCPTAVQRANLEAEGVALATIFVTGNPVVDALEVLDTRRHESEPYVVATLHRASVFPILEHVLALLAAVDLPVRLFAHPRTARAATGLTRGQVQLMPAAPYDEFVDALARCRCVITDSGGVQEEALTLGVPCITFRKSTERPETTWWNGNVIVDPRTLTPRLLQGLVMDQEWSVVKPRSVLGDGRAGERIAMLIEGRYL